MLSFLSALLQIVSLVMKYINEKRVEDAGRAKAILEAWELNNGFVNDALKAGEAKRAELAIDPSKLRDSDKNEASD